MITTYSAYHSKPLPNATPTTRRHLFGLFFILMLSLISCTTLYAAPPPGLQWQVTLPYGGPQNYGSPMAACNAYVEDVKQGFWDSPNVVDVKHFWQFIRPSPLNEIAVVGTTIECKYEIVYSLNVNGTIIEDIEYCRSFSENPSGYACHSIPYPVGSSDCGVGNRYNPETNNCVPDDFNVGEKQCPGTDGRSNIALSGNFYHAEVDFRASDVDGVLVARHFNSMRANRSKGVAGNGWRLSFENSIETTGDIDLMGYPIVVSIRYDGKIIPFSKTPTGWKSAYPVSFGAMRLTELPGGWELSTCKGDKEIYDSLGRMISQIDPNGRQINIEYSASGLITVVTGARSGFAINMSYNSNNELSAVTTSNGATWNYRYDTRGNLLEVTNSRHGARSYAYENLFDDTLLTRRFNANGEQIARYEYDGLGRLAKEYGPTDNQEYSVTYSIDDRARTITNSLGTSIQYVIAKPAGEYVPLSIRKQNCSICDQESNTWKYSTNNAIRSKTQNGILTTYQNHDGFGNPRTIFYYVGTPEQKQVLLEYDTRFINRITKKTEPSVWVGADKVTTTVFDEIGRRISSTVTGYSPSGDAIEKTVSWEYLGPNGLISKIDGPRTDINDVIVFNYYPVSHPIVHERERLRRILLSDRVIKTNIRYNELGKVTHEELESGQVIDHSYNTFGKLLDSTLTGSSLTAVVQREYDAAGFLSAVVKGAMSGDAIRYDFTNTIDGKRVATYDSLGNRKEIEYSLDGQISAERIHSLTGATYSSVTSTYDEFGRLKTVNDRGTNYIHTYNGGSTDKVDTIVDGEGSVASLQYDGRNLITAIIQDGVLMTSLEYDTHGNTVSMTDGRGLTTSYAHDDFGRITSVESPETGYTQYSYDLAGNVIQSINSEGVVTNVSYDAANRILQIERLGTTEIEIEEYVYDNCTYGGGKLCSVTRNDITEVEYTYEPLGQIASLWTPQGNIRYTYNRIGNISSIAYPSGRLVEYSYGADGRISSVFAVIEGVRQPLVSHVKKIPFGPVEEQTWGNGLISRTLYDTYMRPSGKSIGGRDYLSQIAYGNSGLVRSAVDEGALRQFEYNSNGWLSIETGRDVSFEYSYDRNGNRLEKKEGRKTVQSIYDSLSNKLVEEDTTTFEYDTLARLSRRIEKNGDQRVFLYSLSGRLKEVRKVVAKGKFAGESTIAQYRYNSLGQRVEKSVNGGVIRFLYGREGKLLSEKSNTTGLEKDYVYIGNRLLAVLMDVRELASAKREYTFDIGDSIKKPLDALQKTSKWQAQSGNNEVESDNTENAYIWSFPEVSGEFEVMVRWVSVPQNASIATYSLNNRGVVTRYIVDQESNGAKWVSLGTHHFAGGHEQEVSLSNETGRVSRGAVRLVEKGTAPVQLGSTILYVENGLNGAPSLLFDSEGAIVWTGRYEAFGKIQIDSDPDGDGESVELPIRLAGQYHDMETELYYNHFRYYQPSNGRYLKSDPSGLAGGPNTYIYALNNPLSFVDPFGLAVIGVWWDEPYVVNIDIDLASYSFYVGGLILEITFQTKGTITGSILCTDTCTGESDIYSIGDREISKRFSISSENMTGSVNLPCKWLPKSYRGGCRIVAVDKIRRLNEKIERYINSEVVRKATEYYNEAAQAYEDAIDPTTWCQFKDGA